MREWIDSAKRIKLRQILLVLCGSVLSAVAIQVFVRPADLVPSGMSGLSILIIKEINTFSGIELSYGLVYFVINIFVMTFVYKYLGKRFIMLSLIHIFMTSFLVTLIPDVYTTNDEMLLAIFGGAINALGSLLALYAGASTGGTDFVAMAYSRLKNKPMWNYVLMFNTLLLVYAGARYNWQMAFYSIIYQFISMKTIDAYHNRFKLSSITIITTLGDEVTSGILAKHRHGITKQRGIGMYLKKDQDVLYMIVNDYQVNTIIDETIKVDPKAFIEVSKVERVVGNYYQAPIE